MPRTAPARYGSRPMCRNSHSYHNKCLVAAPRLPGSRAIGQLRPCTMRLISPCSLIPRLPSMAKQSRDATPAAARSQTSICTTHRLASLRCMCSRRLPFFRLYREEVCLRSPRLALHLARVYIWICCHLKKNKHAAQITRAPLS